MRILRRVLSDQGIGVEHCSEAEEALRRITRHRFEAIIVDGSNREEAGNVLRAIRTAPVNRRALTIALLEESVELKSGFDMGAHFVLYKPFTVERCKASFRAVRALMKRERRMQMRVPVQIPVDCAGAREYKAKTVDLCEMGMAIQFSGRIAKEPALRFTLELPGMERKLEINGELAWKGNGYQAGVRFKNASDEQRRILREWLKKQLPELDPDDPPVVCTLTDLSLGACYLTTNSPFPRGTRVTLSIKAADLEVRAGGVVLAAHPEFGMGVEFFQATNEQRDQVFRIIAALRSNGGQSPEIEVEPEGLEMLWPEDGMAGLPMLAANEAGGSGDALVDLFRREFQVPVDFFMEQLRAQRQSGETGTPSVTS